MMGIILSLASFGFRSVRVLSREVLLAKGVILGIGGTSTGRPAFCVFESPKSEVSVNSSTRVGVAETYIGILAANIVHQTSSLGLRTFQCLDI